MAEEDTNNNERSRKILRLFKRYLGDKDAEEFLITAGAQNAYANDPEAQKNLALLLSQFPEFVNAIERSFSDYEDRLALAIRNLEISSEELTDTLKNLERLNSNINLMLESLDEGLFFFNEDGICSDVYSQSCKDLVKEIPTGKSLPFVLGFDDTQTQTFNSWLKIVFSGQSAMDFDDLKGLLPSEIKSSQGKTIEIDFKPMYLFDDELEGVLVIAKDITFEIEARQQIQDTQNESMRIKRMAQDRDGLRDFLMDISGFITRVDELTQFELPQEDITLFKRTIHTLKGMSAIYHMLDLQNALHNLENFLEATKGHTVTTSDLKDQLSAIRSIYEQQRHEAETLFGPTYFSQVDFKTLDMSLLNQLKTTVEGLTFDSAPKNEILKFIEREFLSETIEDMLSTFRREIMRICELYGKELPDFIYKNTDIKIESSKYKEFFKSLIHLARNIADHAFEKSSERIIAGKKSNGTVTVSAEITADALNIIIADDGRGIDPQMIRKKLAEKEYSTADTLNDQEILDYIFEAGFSSKQDIDMTSGRGIGMNVIKEEALKLNGTITVTSRFSENKGTCFSITFPL